MDIETKQASMKENPIAQGTGSGVAPIAYPERVEFKSKLQNQNTCSLGLGQVTSVRIRGLINDGQRLDVKGMALPDARQIKAAIERQKGMTGLGVTSATNAQNANPDEDKAH